MIIIMSSSSSTSSPPPLSSSSLGIIPAGWKTRSLPLWGGNRGRLRLRQYREPPNFYSEKNDLHLFLPLSEHEIVANDPLHNWLMTFSENCNHLPILLWVPSSQGLNQILNDSSWLWGKSFNAVRIIIQGWLLKKMCWKCGTFRRVRENWGMQIDIVRDLRLLKTPILPNCRAASPSANLLQENLAKYFHLWHGGDTRFFFLFHKYKTQDAVLNKSKAYQNLHSGLIIFIIIFSIIITIFTHHHHCPHLHHHGGWEEKGERR